MSRRCPNCDQRLLEDEQVCWQCGARLEPVVGDAPARPESKPAEQPLLLYLALTGGIVLAALLMTFFLGRQPRVQFSSAALPEGWLITADQAHNFSVFLPPEWPTLDANNASEVLAERLAATPLYERSLEPLAAFVDDEEILFLATGARPSTFFIAARSPVLNRLSAADASAVAREGDVVVTDARLISSQGADQAAIRVVIEDPNGNQVLCHQRFLRGEKAALLFALCAAEGRLDEGTADSILTSIQQLR
jgi:hypothetical protein